MIKSSTLAAWEVGAAALLRELNVLGRCPWSLDLPAAAPSTPGQARGCLKLTRLPPLSSPLPTGRAVAAEGAAAAEDHRGGGRGGQVAEGEGPHQGAFEVLNSPLAAVSTNFFSPTSLSFPHSIPSPASISSLSQAPSQILETTTPTEVTLRHSLRGDPALLQNRGTSLLWLPF